MPSSSQFPLLGSQTTGFGGNLPNGANQSWNNLFNSVSDNGANTTTANPLTSSNGATYFLKNQQYGHSIPSDATIDGIELLVERAQGGGFYSDYEVRVSGSPGMSSSKTADIGASWATTGVATYGGPTDLWGLSWSASDVNSTLFSTYVSVTGTSPLNPATAGLDYVKTIVYYTEAGGGGGDDGPDFNIKIGGQSISRIMMGSQPVGRTFFGSQDI